MSPVVHIDLPWILQVAQMAGTRDPAAEDLGVPVAACARHQAVLLETPVYSSAYLRAAALVDTLGRCRWLERSNLTVAAACGVMYLEASGITVKPTQQHATALRDLLLDPQCTAARIADALRTWPTTS